MSPLRKLFRRVRYGEPVVVVSGLPRSGTSMAMRMLELGGLDTVTDGERTADEDNPRGYWEDERVKELGKEGVDKSWLHDSRGRAVKIISFLLKDLPPDNNYKVLFMRRDLDEVLASQKKMLERRGEGSDSDDARMRELWENHLWRVGYLLKHQPQFEWIELDYTAVLEDAMGQARRITEFLRMDLDAGRMASAVEAQLYRNRA